MLYRKLGKTNEDVSILGFGTMRLPIIGTNPTNIDEGKAIDMMRQAIDLGVNYVDTAYPYHGTGFTQPGQSELLVAKALKDGYREKVKVATKLPSWLVQKRDDMDRLLDEQLKRLEVDSIDFYLIHSLNRPFWEGVKKADVRDFMDKALSDGRIKYAGFSFHDKLDLFKEIVDYYDWSFCQIQYNYLDETFQAGTEGMKYAADRGLGIVVMEPLRGGNLADLPEGAQSILKQADALKSPAEWGLRWVWDHPEVSVVLSGMTTIEQAMENIKVADNARPNSLTEMELGYIKDVKKFLEQRMKVNCTACSYCMPCPSGINIPGNFEAYNNHWIFDGNPTAKQYYGILQKISAPISNCTECGVCMTHCPQSIQIPDELKKVVALFEA